eukprot:gene7275-biopygen1592
MDCGMMEEGVALPEAVVEAHDPRRERAALVEVPVPPPPRVEPLLPPVVGLGRHVADRREAARWGTEDGGELRPASDGEGRPANRPLGMRRRRVLGTWGSECPLLTCTRDRECKRPRERNGVLP